MLCCAANAPYIMQTNFTADQLRDPQIAEANASLQTCVHYGFCTNTCPTYVLTRDENESPRGRVSHGCSKRRCARSGKPSRTSTAAFMPVLHDDLRGEGGLRPSDRPRAGYQNNLPLLTGARCVHFSRACCRARVFGAAISLARHCGVPSDCERCWTYPAADCVRYPCAAGVSGGRHSAEARGAPRRLRAAGAEWRHQRSDDPAVAATRLRSSGRARIWLLWVSQSAYGTRGRGACVRAEEYPRVGKSTWRRARCRDH